MIKRQLYIDKLNEFKNIDFIKVIVGIRRCGKTTLLKTFMNELINEGIPNENIIYISFESLKYNHIKNSKELDEVVLSLTKNITGKVYLFFDEIQEVEDWEKSINGYRVDLDSDIYVTGSNSQFLSTNLSSILTGRYVLINVYPFSFREILQYKKEIENITINKDTENDIFDEFMKFGGMPGILPLKNEESKLAALTDIFNTIIFRDIITRYKIKNSDMFERFTYYLINTTGETFSANSISNFFKNLARKVSKDTILRYANYLVDSFFILKAKRFNLKGKNVLKIYEKYYLTDHGFHQSIVGHDQDAYTNLLENIIYIELLRRGYDVKVGDINNKEVDFVCEKYGNFIYIQVSYKLENKNTQEREFKPLLMIDDNYDKYILSMDTEDYSKRGIKHINIIDFLKYDEI